LTKLGTYLVLKRIWNSVDFQGQRSRSPGQIFRRGDTPRFALPVFILMSLNGVDCCSLVSVKKKLFIYFNLVTQWSDCCSVISVKLKFIYFNVTQWGDCCSLVSVKKNDLFILTLSLNGMIV
jgi:hypothetical protein